MVHLSKLDDLKATMQSGARLSQVWHQFFDLTETRDFIQASVPGELEYLAPIIKVVGNADGRKPKRVFQEPMVMRYGGSDFYHGSISCPGYMGAFIYFKDVDQGSLSLTDIRSLESVFFKFALTMIGEGRAVVLPGQASGKAGIH